MHRFPRQLQSRQHLPSDSLGRHAAEQHLRQSNRLCGNSGGHTQLGPLRAGDRRLPLDPWCLPIFCDMEPPDRPKALPTGAWCLSGRGRATAALKEVIIVWWADLLWGFWNGLTAWIVLIVHVFGGWEDFPFYNAAKSGNWYDFGFLLGAGSPLLGAVGGRGRRGH